MIFIASITMTLMLTILKLMGIMAMPWVLVILSLFFIPWVVIGFEVLVISLIDLVEALTDE